MQAETAGRQRLGVIGTGTLSAAVIEGLLAVHGDRLEIMVSPRSEAVSRDLAERYPQVTRASSNQAVVDAADIVLLGVRPQHLDEVMARLRLRADQTVLSFVAGAGLARLAPLCAPATRVLRVTPLPPIARRQGPILVFPGDPETETLFAGLGTVIVPENADQIMALGYAGGLMASFFEMALAAIRWLEAEGVPRSMGRDYVMSMFAALGDTGLRTPADSLEGLPGEHATPGGINERCLNQLSEAGWFADYASGLEAMKTHLEGLDRRSVGGAK